MLFADANFVISLEVAATIGTALGAGVAGAAKLLVGYMRRRDKEYARRFSETAQKNVDLSNQLAAIVARFDVLGREIQTEHREMTRTLLAIQKDTLETLGEMRVTVGSLSDRVSRLDNEGTGEHAPHKSPPPPPPGRRKPYQRPQAPSNEEAED